MNNREKYQMLIYGRRYSILEQLKKCWNIARKKRAIGYIADKEEITVEHNLSEEEYESVQLVVYQLLEFAKQVGISGNLWKMYLCAELVRDANVYSQAREMRKETAKGLEKLAFLDMEHFYRLYHYDGEEIAALLGEEIRENLFHFAGGEPEYGNQRFHDVVYALNHVLESALDAAEFFAGLNAFYETKGVGNYAIYSFFRFDNSEDSAFLSPVVHTDPVCLDDLVGYELQKKQLLYNTSCFARGDAANNVLLYGDSGTGKSTAIRAIVNEFAPQGVRMIELYKNQIFGLNELMEMLEDRHYRFIIYMDDLSFEENETEYKYLKAVIDGGIKLKPENILIYATSNRRHLVREVLGDRSDMGKNDREIHRSDNMEEKLSLAQRFGVSIYFGKPTPKEYLQIVKELARRENIMMEEEELILKARQWELSHGSMCGRIARQFIDHIKAMQGEEDL